MTNAQLPTVLSLLMVAMCKTGKHSFSLSTLTIFHAPHIMVYVVKYDYCLHYVTRQSRASYSVCYTLSDAGTCDETLTLALDSNIAINASITTCIECRIRGILATTVQCH